MRRPLAVVAVVLLAPSASAVDRAPSGVVSFARPALNLPGGWQTTSRTGIRTDDGAVRDGKPSLRIVRSARTPGDSAISLALPIDFAGNEIVLRGWLRTEAVTGMAGLFLVEDDAAGNVVAVEDMEARPARGTRDWAEFAVSADIEVRPTLAGLRAGHDEVLEPGVRTIVGERAAADLVEHLAPRRARVRAQARPSSRASARSHSRPASRPGRRPR